MHHYRLYTDAGSFIAECWANNYVEAKEKFAGSATDKIFSVEDDNHEIECGMAWIEDLLEGN